jgi:thiosulfate/3-mercaptopyruvate sulfurtransferase
LRQRRRCAAPAGASAAGDDDGACVSAAWLAAAAAAGGGPTLLDVRPRGAYLDGHIVGAVHAAWARDCAAAAAPGDGGGGDGDGPPGGRLRSDLDGFAAAVEAKGVSCEAPAVVCDACGGRAAAGVWWALLAAGHPQARVLAGGVDAWPGGTELYEPCTLKVAAYFEASPSAARISPAALAAEAAAGGGALVLDARESPAAGGSDAPPGAVSLPASALLDGASGGLLPPAAAAAVLAAAGVRLGDAPPRQLRLLIYAPGDAPAGAVLALALQRAGQTGWSVCDGGAWGGDGG